MRWWSKMSARIDRWDRALSAGDRDLGRSTQLDPFFNAKQVEDYRGGRTAGGVDGGGMLQ